MIKHNVSGIWNSFSIMRDVWITECLISEPLPDIKHGFYVTDYKKTDAMLHISYDVWLSHYTGFHSFSACCISETPCHDHCIEIILSWLCNFIQLISFHVAVNSKFEYRNVSGYNLFMNQNELCILSCSYFDVCVVIQFCLMKAVLWNFTYNYSRHINIQRSVSCEIDSKLLPYVGISTSLLESALN
jgi:hypothetical protein